LIQECEAGLAGEVGEVGEAAGGEVVYAEDRVGAGLGEEGVGEVGAEEASGSGDEDFLCGHGLVSNAYSWALAKVASSGSRTG